MLVRLMKSDATQGLRGQRRRVPHLVVALAFAVLLGTGNHARAQRDLQDIPDPDPELERRELEVAEGFEIQLYAADPLMAKPIQMNFDDQGRLWIAASEVYPQIKPGQVADDKVLVLEDTDHDGRADKTTVFASGLLIPTGVLPGDGGCYVANSTELIHLADTDGDGKADRNRVVLSGFGTEDTHHILHTLRWGPDGALYMNQSIYIHSHIETPHGVRRMNGSGVWRFQPESLELETFTLGLVNPWGHAWNRTGVSFETDGAGGEGINYVFPGFVGLTSPGAVRILPGLNPGKPKLCGLEIVEGTALPDDWQGNLVTNDFRAHRVCRYVVTESGSGYASEEKEELVKSRHVAFRPIDVKQGPDGAIYIADWYNPIIQHGEVDFRDPRRDHVHGRIWRVTAKGRSTVPPVDLRAMSAEQLVKQLDSPETWRREQTRRVLKERGATAVIPALDQWVAALNAPSTAGTNVDQGLLEALWIYQSLDRIPASLLGKTLAADDPGVRAAAVRVLYHEGHRFPETLDWLKDRVVDSHARVRLEAVRALGRQKVPEACEIAMRALDLPQDKFLEFATWTTARELEPIWLPALREGRISFAGNADHLIYALQAVNSANVAEVVAGLLDHVAKEDVAREQAILAILGRIGDASQLRRVLDGAMRAERSAAQREELLALLETAARERKVQPAEGLEAVGRLLADSSPATRQQVVRLIGAWRVASEQPAVAAIASDSQAAEDDRATAMLALADLGGPDALQTLEGLARSGELAANLRMRAVAALLQGDVSRGVPAMVDLLSDLDASADPSPVLEACLAVKGAPALLATALQERQVPRDVATRALRAVERSGQSLPDLVAALGRAGQLQQSPWNLSEDEKRQLLADALARGDAARGQQVYRRAALTCQQCHGIGGAGGQVGPDLASIGASAQPDYLLESILEPGKKIKENYHSLIVETEDGDVVTGIKVRETDQALILRDAKNVEHAVPLNAIAARSDGGSLMPNGLLDQLTRDELLDLVRFLSELGKVGGPYNLPRETYVRSWQVLLSSDANADQLSSLGVAQAAGKPEEFTWEPVYSLVSGELPTSGLPAVPVGPGQRVVVLRGEVELAAGDATHRLLLSPSTGVSVWVDGEPWQDGTAQLPAGRHAILLVVKPGEATAVSVQLP